jgi:predicted GTPase
VVVINKVDSATPGAVSAVRASVAALNPRAAIVEARSALRLEGGEVQGRRVVVVEDGPTLTHGGMTFGAGIVAARRFGAAEIVDPRSFATGSIRAVLERYPALERLIPAMGYGDEQVRELEATLNAAPADVVLCATPIDLGALMHLRLPVIRVRYDLEEVAGTSLADAIAPVIARGRAAQPVGR